MKIVAPTVVPFLCLMCSQAFFASCKPFGCPSTTKVGWENLGGPATVLSVNTNHNSLWPSIAFDPYGNALGVWVAGGQNYGYLSVFAPRLNAHGCVEDVYVDITNNPRTPGTVAGLPRIAVDRCSNALAVWQEQLNSSSPSIVYARRYWTPKPRLTTAPLEPNKLVRVDESIIGAPIKSIAWLCDECTGGCPFNNKLAAVAGVCVDGADIRLYERNGDKLMCVASVTRGTTSLSVSWCCIAGIPYLAVGGVSDDKAHEVTVFKLTPKPLCIACASCPGSWCLEPVATYQHGADVRSIAWLSNGCHDQGSKRVLAIGGDMSPYDGFQARLLSFDAVEKNISTITNFMYPAAVNTLSWCTPTTCAKPLLAVAGDEAAPGLGSVIDILICDRTTLELVPLCSLTTSCASLYQLCWCCTCDPVLFAVPSCPTGLSAASSPAFMSYRLKPSTGTLVPHTYPERLRCYDGHQVALACVPTHNTCCALMTVGTSIAEESQFGQCQPNIFVVGPDNPLMTCFFTRTVATAHFDRAATALSWCCTDEEGGCSYLLVGSDRANQDGREPACDKPELALYKALFDGRGLIPCS